MGPAATSENRPDAGPVRSCGTWHASCGALRSASIAGAENRRENLMAHRTAETREEWQAANGKQLAREKELERLSEELTRGRRELPWLRIEKEYTLETAEGPKT